MACLTCESNNDSKALGMKLSRERAIEAGRLQALKDGADKYYIVLKPNGAGWTHRPITEQNIERFKQNVKVYVKADV